jgi:hypothetical protein
MAKFSSKGLDKVKVGDLVASIQTTVRGPARWTGTLRPVTKVGARRFCLGSNEWIVKATGFAIGRSMGFYYVLATPEMIAEVDRKRREGVERQQEQDTFRGRADYRHAIAIWHLLESMNPDNHPLDRLTVDEWAAFHNKLTGTEEK